MRAAETLDLRSELASRRLRTLVVNPYGEVGGAELYLLRLLDQTGRLDVEVVLLRDGPLRHEFERRGVPVRVVPVGRTGTDIVKSVPGLARVLSDSTADVVLANGVKAQAVVGPAARLVGLPVVWIKHDHSYDRVLTPVLARLATEVVATAADVAAAVKRSDVVLLQPSPPPPPHDRPTARALLSEHGVVWRDGVRYLAMLTRLTPYKGVDVAVEAVARTPGWELLVLGADDPAEPGERARITRLAGSAGAVDRVHLLGHLDDAGRLLTAVDALAVLTRDGGARTPGCEGFGMAAMEAMVAGVPVLAPDDGGAVAARTADGAGILVDPTDAADVATALRTLSGTERHRAASAAARARAGQFASADASADRLVRLLAETAHRPGAGRSSATPVSVVIPVLDEVAVVDEVVSAVLSQLGAGDELLVVDSGSSDGTRERLHATATRDDRLRVLEVGRCSIGASRNHGTRAARHALVVCTDAGCRPDPGWLDRFRAAMSEAEGPDLVVGTYRAGMRPHRPFEHALAAVAWPDPVELARAPLLVAGWLRTVGPRFSPTRVDGRSVGFSRDAWRRAGGFPEELTTSEDEAFGRRVVASGSRSTVLVDASVTWAQRSTVGDAFHQFRGYGRGGGASRSPLLLAHDAARGAAYAAALGGLMTRRRTPAAVLATVLLAGPAHRVVRRRHPLPVLLLLPAAQLLKDTAQLTGALEAVVLGRHGSVRRPGSSSPDGGR